jgi:hypothetical protein
MLAALNDLELKSGNVHNAYLVTAPPNEKVAMICGLEFGVNQGQTALIERALYGLKSSGATYQNPSIASCMRHLGYYSLKSHRILYETLGILFVQG